MPLFFYPIWQLVLVTLKNEEKSLPDGSVPEAVEHVLLVLIVSALQMHRSISS